MMMLALFAKASEEGLHSAVSAPFAARPFYATPAMQTLFNSITSRGQMKCNLDFDSIMQFKTI
ncbi:MAG: hypothetical protein ACI959_001383 [Limisphaerales bacterium]|jgi:hypothetical protein